MSNKKKNKEGFWQRVFRRYDIVASQHGYHGIEHRVSVSRFGIFFCLLVAASLVVAATTVVLFYSPLKRYMPGYVSPQQRVQLLEASQRVDSLYEAVERQKLYVMNLQDIFRGDIKVDTVSTIDSLTVLRSADLMNRTDREADFVRNYEENEKYNLTSPPLRKSDMEGLHFTTPLHGMLGDAFNPSAQHYGIDLIATAAHQNVCSVLDGSVLMSSYTATDGYVIVVQHVGNLVSIYKHLSSPMKHEGEKVKAGDVIGILGKKAGKPSHSYLHLELWHKGTALDPTQYISF